MRVQCRLYDWVRVSLRRRTRVDAHSGVRLAQLVRQLALEMQQTWFSTLDPVMVYCLIDRLHASDAILSMLSWRGCACENINRYWLDTACTTNDLRYLKRWWDTRRITSLLLRSKKTMFLPVDAWETLWEKTPNARYKSITMNILPVVFPVTEKLAIIIARPECTRIRNVCDREIGSGDLDLVTFIKIWGWDHTPELLVGRRGPQKCQTLPVSLTSRLVKKLARFWWIHLHA